jgi:FAD/FMN-containing dehydrogenase/ferredoxin
MRDNVLNIEAVLMNGETMRFGELSGTQATAQLTNSQHSLVTKLLNIGHREAPEIQHRFPDLMRRVGGYNIDALMPNGIKKGDWAQVTTVKTPRHPNLAHLLVGSEGTLAFSTRIQLNLQPLPQNKVLGVCHFPTFHQAMDSARHIVKLGPTAVELVDRTMIGLARDIPMFSSTVEKFVVGKPDALLLVEFSGEDYNSQLSSLNQLSQLMGDLGLHNSVVEAIDSNFQKAIWEVRKSGLNIMMSMKGDGKPISFIEDCAVKLEDLADYTARLTQVFNKHGTTGTWYAHASVGCLHVRPVINLKSEVGAKKMRAIAEEAFAMVRAYKGSHSGEHGDGLVRSEFHEPMFGKQITTAFENVKDAFDPSGLFNPGKIVRASKMDDRSLFRFKPGYKIIPLETAFDWSAWGGLSGAVEMCNNNGACRKMKGGVMCPSFRATRKEKDLTRGRANTLRLAISGQLGPDAFTSDQMADTMKLCVSCKGCKRECPTGVDMSKMKIEVLSARAKKNGISWRDKLVAYLPRYAPWAARIPRVMNLRNTIPGLAKMTEGITGFTAKRNLPTWSTQPFKNNEVEEN